MKAYLFETDCTEDDINKQINEAIDNIGRWHGMSYEEGVRNALDWILGNSYPPMEDDE